MISCRYPPFTTVSMYLQNISIINYKNIQAAEIDLSPKMNCFIGQNGVGKTNFLDAVYFLSFCRSANNSIDSQLILHDKDFFVIEGNYIRNDGEKENVYCGLKRGMKKHFKRNKKEYKRLSQHIGFIPLILVSPSDTSLILGGSEERRKLMDMIISQCDTTYLDSLNNYNKALLQRNALLKLEHEPDRDLMDIWEERMAVEGKRIYEYRSQLIEQLTPIFMNLYHEISDGREEVSLRYISHCQRGELLDVIRRDRVKDRAVGYSLHGIHRDDLEMLIDGYSLKKEGSQGQHKTFVIALKLAQFDYICQQNLMHNNNTTPLLLLDDIFDKLDAHRVEQIMHIVANDRFGQIFITDTNREHLDRILQHGQFEHHLFHVSGGEFIRK